MFHTLFSIKPTTLVLYIHTCLHRRHNTRVLAHSQHLSRVCAADCTVSPLHPSLTCVTITADISMGLSATGRAKGG